MSGLKGLAYPSSVVGTSTEGSTLGSTSAMLVSAGYGELCDTETCVIGGPPGGCMLGST